MSPNTIRKIQGTIRGLRNGWLIIGLTLLLFLALEFGLRGLFAVKDRLMNPVPPDPRVIRDGYGGETWPIVHYRELEALVERWEPYIYYRQSRFQGETISIDDLGHRAVWAPPDLAENPKTLKLLTLGGSSLWGFGARDHQTIPSLLARSLDEEGIAADVRNLAEIGYVNTQEMVALVRELQSGYRPDLVLFFDGANDTASALLKGETMLTMAERNREREYDLLKHPGRMAFELAAALFRNSALQRAVDSIRHRVFGVRRMTAHVTGEAKLDALARGVVDGYIANLDIIETLADRYGFRPIFVWQPVVFRKARPTDFEQYEAGKLSWAVSMFAKVSNEIQRSEALQSRRNFLDLSDVFGDSPDLVFIDYCHLTEEGNARVTRAILERLREFLPPSAEARPH